MTGARAATSMLRPLPAALGDDTQVKLSKTSLQAPSGHEPPLLPL